MTLEEGIRILKNEKNETFSPYQVLEARDTLINYIENESIPKEKVKTIYEDYTERIRYIDDNNFERDNTYYEYIKICDVLQELLGE